MVFGLSVLLFACDICCLVCSAGCCLDLYVSCFVCLRGDCGLLAFGMSLWGCVAVCFVGFCFVWLISRY